MVEVEQILQRAVEERVTPGLAANIFVAGAEEQALRLVKGTLGYGAQEAVSDETIYDLASLTKVLCTTLLTCHAIQLGKLDILEKPWPSWPGVSVLHVLEHTSGLPAWAPFYRRTPHDVLAQVLATKPTNLPGVQVVYSDLGFIALGDLLQNRLGNKLDVLFIDVAQRHYGNTALTFHPDPLLVAPTDYCPWRKRVLRGDVNDANCYAMGGVSGHAGLFGCAKDVESAARFFLDAICGNEQGLPGLVRQFATHNGKRPLGFDRVSIGGSTGNALSPRSVGHLGFTGTSLWLDPQSQAVYILLSNRYQNGGKKTGIKHLRVSFHEAAARFLFRNS